MHACCRSAGRGGTVRNPGIVLKDQRSPLFRFAREHAPNTSSVFSGTSPVARDEVDVDVHDVLPCGLPDVDADVVAVGVAVGSLSTAVVVSRAGRPLRIGRIEVTLTPERDQKQVTGPPRVVVAGVTGMVCGSRYPRGPGCRTDKHGLLLHPSWILAQCFATPVSGNAVRVIRAG